MFVRSAKRGNIRSYRSATWTRVCSTLSGSMAAFPSRIRIATRESRLALRQTELVAAALAARHPGLAVETVGMTTKGDRVLDRPLAEVGGKGLFVKELEVAL